MHELGLCASIVDAVERRANSRPVARVRVRVGCLHHVHPDAFEQSFEMAAGGSVAEGAVAELVLVPASAVCAACGASTEVTGQVEACPKCASLDVVLDGGDELTLELIEYRSEEHVPGHPW